MSGGNGPAEEVVAGTEEVILDRPGDEPVGEVDESIDHVVLLVHGIRTRAFWQETVKEVLEEVHGLVAVPIRYGDFPLPRFVVPGPWRMSPSRRIRRELRLAQQRYPNAEISVVCHSFGTFSVCRALEEGIGIRLRHLILCGSVLPGDFKWPRLDGKISQTTVNDVGVRDIWPVFARLASVGFGDSGTFGFGSVAAHDRFFDFRHSDFFSRKFVREHWLPILSRDAPSPVPTPFGRRPPNPKWITWIAKLPRASLFWSTILVAFLGLTWLSAPATVPLLQGAATAVASWRQTEPVADGALARGAITRTSAAGVVTPPPPEPKAVVIHGEVSDIEFPTRRIDDLVIEAGPTSKVDRIPAEYEPPEYSVEISIAEDEEIELEAYHKAYVQLEPRKVGGPWALSEYRHPIRVQLRTSRAERDFERADRQLDQGHAENAWTLFRQAWKLVPRDRYLEALPATLPRIAADRRQDFLLDLNELAGEPAFAGASVKVRYKVFFALGRVAAAHTDLSREIGASGKTYYSFAIEAFARAIEARPGLAEPFQAKMQLELRAGNHFDAAATARSYFDHPVERHLEDAIEAILTDWTTAVEEGTGFVEPMPLDYENSVRGNQRWLEHWRALATYLSRYEEYFSAGPSKVDRRLRTAQDRAARILRSA